MIYGGAIAGGRKSLSLGDTTDHKSKRVFVILRPEALRMSVPPKKN